MIEMNDHLLSVIISCTLSSYIFNFLEQRSTNYHWWAKSGLPSIFVSKVLLEHNHAHLFLHCLWLLSCCDSRVLTTQTV